MNATGILVELERHGLQVRLAGDKIAVSPKEAITDDLRQIIRANRAEILSTLQRTSASSGREIPPASDRCCPWPLTLEGLGPKKVGALKSCLWCGAGSWVRYAGLPTCLSCARSWPGNQDPEAAKAYLWRLLDLWAGMDESPWSEANVTALKDDIMDLFRDHPEANAWFREWRAAHPTARLA